jgi:PiT family inorganic phosphate transporter
MSFSHGTNDAQKTMGIIALTLFTATTKTNAFDHLPSWLEFLRAPEFKVYAWIKVMCALTMAAGTAIGGWRIIRTLGHKIVKMQPIHGFAAQSTAAGIIQLATHWGIPLSTTHVISASIMGVGATKRFSAVKWGIVGNMVWAWILTIPITGLLAYGLMLLLRGLVRVCEVSFPIALLHGVLAGTNCQKLEAGTAGSPAHAFLWAAHRRLAVVGPTGRSSGNYAYSP